MSVSKVSNLASVCTQPQSLLYTMVQVLFHFLNKPQNAEIDRTMFFPKNCASTVLHKAVKNTIELHDCR